MPPRPRSGGKLADLFDTKKLLQLGIVIIVSGSMLTGFPINIPMLMSARVVRGIGMGMAVIGTVIPPRERGRHSGYFGGVMAAGVIPLRVIFTRTTALAIPNSISIGVAVFGSGAFLGKFFRVALEATPKVAGLMILPMSAGNPFGSVFPAIGFRV
ncbi:MFS transporter [Paeniglutamicibacter antarcticus]|uniref:MFS transporter n=1 Tax=Paeniglutamicibacter antarcticus TaxID=494023 RepID=A0ABP9TH98_9MICC